MVLSSFADTWQKNVPDRLSGSGVMGEDRATFNRRSARTGGLQKQDTGEVLLVRVSRILARFRGRNYPVIEIGQIKA